MTEQQESEQGAVAERRHDRYPGDVELAHGHTPLGRWLAAFARWLADTVAPTPRWPNAVAILASSSAC